MIAIDIEFEDLDGNTAVHKQDFHLNKKDLLRLQVMHEDGYGAYVQQELDSRDGDRIIAAFDHLLGLTVGVRSADGRKFERSEEYKKNFLESEYGSEFWVKLVTDAEYAGWWFQNVVPKKLLEETQKQVEGLSPEERANVVELPTAPPVLEPSTDEDTAGTPEDTRTFDQHTREELVAMDDVRFYKLVGTDKIQKMNKVQQSIMMQRLQNQP